MTTDNKDQSTHYSIPIEINDTEIEALQEVVDMYLVIEEIYKGTEKSRIYDALVVIQGLLDKINTPR